MNKVRDAVPAKVDAKAKKAPAEDIDPEFEGLMSEIETDLRADEFKKIWKSYGNLIIALVMALVLGVTGFQLYRQYETRQREAAGRRYETAIKSAEAGKRDEAITQLSEVIKDGGGYGSLARLSQAALQIEKSDVDGAVANYKALAADPKADPIFRDLATLLRVLHSLDREDPKTLEAALTPLASPNNAFNLSALELQALLAAKQGDTDRAIKTLAQVSTDPMTPTNMRERAEDLTKLYQSGIMPAPPAAPTLPAAAPAVAPAPAAPAAPGPAKP